MSEQQWTWQPVDNQEDAITAAMQHILRWDKLPADIALCRRVPTSAQSVPVDASVRKAIEIVIGRSEEAGPYQQTRRTLLDACARIEDWLAGLPEQEAGHD